MISTFDNSRSLRLMLSSQQDETALVGHSPQMEKIFRTISKAAFSKHPVMIHGASGTGKELIARTIHKNGPNASRPFLPIRCSALSFEAMERELFGYAQGAFAGAAYARAGLLAEADTGTVFFKGVDDLPLALQAKLADVLRDRAVRPIGSREDIPIHARILASAGKNPVALVDRKTLLPELYFQLNVITIRVPALATRKEDIPVLTDHILRGIREESGIPFELSSEAMQTLLTYAWPGNVRELKSALERVCALASGPFLTVRDLPSQIQQTNGAYGLTQHTQSAATPASLPTSSIAELEKEAILNTLRQLHGDKLQAARLLGIGKTTLYRKLKTYGIAIANSS